MPRSQTTTVAAYLASLPPDRRAELAKVRGVIRKHLPRGYRETVNWGMISYEIPLSRVPKTYNGQPLCYAMLGAHQEYSTLYLMSVYMNAELNRRLRDGFRQAGKKLDMGKSCIRFRKAEDLALDAIGQVIASMPMEKWIALAEAAQQR